MHMVFRKPDASLMFIVGIDEIWRRRKEKNEKRKESRDEVKYKNQLYRRLGEEHRFMAVLDGEDEPAFIEEEIITLLRKNCR